MPRLQAGSSPLTRGKQIAAWFYSESIGLIPAHAGKTGFSDSQGDGCAAHPRSRGENSLWTRFTAPSPGSSPLTRGKLALDSVYRAVTGLIPAHAGKTVYLRRSGSRHWGSSPLTRGKRSAFRSGRARRGAHPRSRGENHTGRKPCAHTRRLIPAHAGKTGASSRPARAGAAHPRSRGENAMSDGQISADEGSSPLTRGKLCRVVRGGQRTGLIPAHAGKTTPRARSR